MKKNLLILTFIIATIFTLSGQCSMYGLTYTLPSCNISGDTIRLEWNTHASCPDTSYLINLVNEDTNTSAQQIVLNYPDSTVFHFPVNLNMIPASYRFNMQFHPNATYSINGPNGYMVNDPQIDVLEKFYEDFDGDSWAINTGWLSDCDPCGATSGNPWYGLQCNGSDKITHLVLTGNTLTGSFSSDLPGNMDHLCDLTDLEVVDLSYNNISGELPACLFNATRDVYLDNNAFSGELPSTINSLTAASNIDVSDNNLEGCFDNLWNPLCELSQLTNAQISDGNDFDGEWETYCMDGKGVCCLDTFDVDLTTFENGTYYAKKEIHLSGNSSVATDITLSSKKVLIDQSIVHSSGANIEVEAEGCRTNAALNLDGINDQLSLNPFSLSGNFTINFWFRTDMSYSGTEPRILTMGPNARLEVGLNPGNHHLWFYDDDVKTGNTPLNDNVWHHVSIVNVNTEKFIYVDGVLEINYDSGNSAYSYLLYVATWFSGSTRFGGEIDDLRIYTTNLSENDILAEYNCSDFRNDSDLMLHYTFDDGIPYNNNASTTTIEDESGNGNDATIYNMTLMDSVSNFVDPVEPPILPCCANPLVIGCFSVAAALIPVDTDGDNIPDAEQVTVLAESFDDGSTDGCGGSDFIVSFTPDGNTTEMLYDCDDIGTTMITMYFIAGNGSVLSCNTSIMIVDQNDVEICP